MKEKVNKKRYSKPILQTFGTLIIDTKGGSSRCVDGNMTTQMCN